MGKREGKEKRGRVKEGEERALGKTAEVWLCKLPGRLLEKTKSFSASTSANCSCRNPNTSFR